MMTHFKYALIVLFAVVFTWLLHEFAHWLTGEWLGNDMVMTLNTCYPKSGEYLADWHATVISAAGPIITLLQAFIVYYMLKTKPYKLLFPFLLTCLYMRFLAGGMNFINLNDEGRVSMELGLGIFTLPLIIVGVLLYLTISTSKNREFKSTFILASTLLIMVFSSILILTDQALHVKIL